MTLLIQHIADWLLTWFLHATVACTLAMLVGDFLVGDPRLRDLLWKGSLLTPIATSLISVFVGRTSIELGNGAHAHAPGTVGAVTVSVQSTVTGVSQVRVDDPIAQWLPAIVIAFLILPAAVACFGAARKHCRLSKDLRSRRRLDIGQLGVDSRTLSFRGGAAYVTISPQITSAAALRSREICVSPGFLSLGTREKQGVIAHEVAHLERSDPAWQRCADFISAVLIAQPLARLIAGRLRRDAEFICDEIAIRRTGDRVAYLRALTAFAERQETGQFAAVAYGDSQIIQRAQRVLAINSVVRRTTRERLVMVGVAILCLSTLLALPHIKTGSPASRVITRVVPQVSSAETHVSVTIDGRAISR
jgi:beta-lactamase regulating signal transducer with metallopeptidase domain